MSLRTKILKEGMKYRGSDTNFENNYELSKFIKQYANEVVSEGTETTFNKYYLAVNPIGRKLLRNLKENDEYVRSLATVKSPLLFEGYLEEAGPQINVGDGVAKQQAPVIDETPFKTNPVLKNKVVEVIGSDGNPATEQTFEDIVKNMSAADALKAQKSMDLMGRTYLGNGTTAYDKDFGRGVFTPENSSISASMMEVAKENPEVLKALKQENPELAKAIMSADSAAATHTGAAAATGFLGWLQGVWDSFGKFFKGLFTDPIGTITGTATSFGSWIAANPLTFGALAAIPVGLVILSKIKKRKGAKSESK